MNTVLDLLNNIIKYNDSSVSFLIDIKNIIWFKFNDISKILGLKRPTDSLYLIENGDKTHLKEIKLITKIASIHPDTVYITESGLYTFLIRSSMKIAKDFQIWLTKEVLPTLREQGSYEVKLQLKEKIKKLNKKVSLLTKQKNELLENQKPKSYPDGMYMYALKSPASEIYPEMYKVGITDSLNKRITSYNSIATNRLAYAYVKKIQYNSKEIDNCVKAMLYQYRYRSNKEHFECSLEKIKKAIGVCVKANKVCNPLDKELEVGKLTDYIKEYNVAKIKYLTE